MRNTYLKSLAVTALAGLALLASSASAVVLPPPATPFVPGSVSAVIGGNDSLAEIQRRTQRDCLEEIYKNDYNKTSSGTESGQKNLFAVTYDSKPAQALLDYTGPIPSLYDWSNAYIVVKGGNQFVYYSLAGWDGIVDILVTNAHLPLNNPSKPNSRPGISHVTVYACRAPDQNVPEGGASVALLGLGLAGLGLSRRFLAKKA